MSNHDRRSEWTVLLGIGLVGLGIWLFLGSFAGWIVAPIAAIISVASRVIWPLILIGLGVLLVLRARGGGWAPSGRPLYRSREERMIAGVLGGVAKWLGVNPTPIRIAFVVLTVFSGLWAGVLAYVLGAVLLAEEPWSTPDGYVPPTPPQAPPAPAPPVPPTPQPSEVVEPIEPAVPQAPPVAPEAAPQPPAAPTVPEAAPEPPAAPTAPEAAPEPPAAPAVPPAPPAPPAS